MKTLHVKTPSGAHPITIGRSILESSLPEALERTGSELLVVVTNTTLEKLHLKRLLAAVQPVAPRVKWLSIPDGERYKTLGELERIYDALMGWHANRQTTLLAFGGGVVGDMTGLAAATYMRGVPYIQVPTTLLAFVDSSVGGKTAVNHPRGKNSIGAFKQPSAVVMELDFLNTLPQRELRAGLFELIKHGIIRDLALFDFMAAQQEYAFDSSAAFWEEAIARSCMVKRDVVQADEHEKGVRAILNFGHSLAHLLETHTQYKACLHGEAVGVGMLFAAFVSRQAWGLPAKDWQKIGDTLAPWLTPINTPPLTQAQFVNLLSHDKKATRRGLNFIALSRLGQAVMRPDTQPADLWSHFKAFVQQYPQLLPGLANSPQVDRSPPLDAPTATAETKTEDRLEQAQREEATAQVRAMPPFSQPTPLPAKPLATVVDAKTLASNPLPTALRSLDADGALAFLKQLACHWQGFAKAWHTLLPFAQQAPANAKDALQTRMYHALVKQIPAWFSLPAGPGAHCREWSTLHAMETVLNPGYFSLPSVEQMLPDTLQGKARQQTAHILCQWLQLRQQGIPKPFPHPTLEGEEMLGWVELLPSSAWESHWQGHLDALESSGLAAPAAASMLAWGRFGAGHLYQVPSAENIQAWQQATWRFQVPQLVLEGLGEHLPTTHLIRQPSPAVGPTVVAATSGANTPDGPAVQRQPATLSAMANLVSAAFAGRFGALDIAGPCGQTPTCGHCPFGLAAQQQPRQKNVAKPPLCTWAAKNAQPTSQPTPFGALEADAWFEQHAPADLPDSWLLQVALHLDAPVRERFEQALLQTDLASLAQQQPADVAHWAKKYGLPAQALQALFALLTRLKGKRLHQGQKMSTAQDVFFHCGPHMGSLKQEQLLLLMLDRNKCLIGERIISQGSLELTHFHARDIFSPAIQQGAHSIIIVHNHPSGNPQPSKADVTLTKVLEEAAQLLQIPLIDHIIVGGDAYVSLREAQWLDAPSN